MRANELAPAPTTIQQNLIVAHPLTERELDVLYLIAEGLTTKEIASRLQIAFRTAGAHREHILKKLRVRSSIGAVLWAIRAGLIKP